MRRLALPDHAVLRPGRECTQVVVDLHRDALATQLKQVMALRPDCFALRRSGASLCDDGQCRLTMLRSAVTVKQELLRSLRQVMGTPVLPTTYLVDNRRGSFRCEDLDLDLDERAVWFLKAQRHGDRGNSVHLSARDACAGLADTSYVLQRQVDNLAAVRGHKFDVRFYLVVVKNDYGVGGFIARTGYARICPLPFDAASTEKGVHVCNTQPRLDFETLLTHPEGGRVAHFWTVAALCAELGLERGKLFADATAVATLALTMGGLGLLMENETEPGLGLFAADFVVDATGQPWLLEFSPSPNLHFAPAWPEFRAAVAQLKEDLVFDFLHQLAATPGEPVRVNSDRWYQIYLHGPGLS